MKFLFVVEGHPEIGYGHFMRSLALAEAGLEQNHHIKFYGRYSRELQQRLDNRSIPYSETTHGSKFSENTLETIVEVAAKKSFHWVVLDDYRPDSDFISTLTDQVSNLLVLDDNVHRDQYHCTAILNHNLYATDEMYADVITPETKLLLGERYTLLQKNFRRWSDWIPSTPDIARKILITMGGTDPRNATESIVEALPDPKYGEHYRIVTGASNPNLMSLRSKIENRGFAELLVDCQSMDEQMKWADLAIASGGSTNWELTYMGVPTLNIILSDNQVKIVKALESRGLSFNLGHIDDFDPEEFREVLNDFINDQDQREIISRRRRTLIDDMGVHRVMNHLSSDTS